MIPYPIWLWYDPVGLMALCSTPIPNTIYLPRLHYVLPAPKLGIHTSQLLSRNR